MIDEPKIKSENSFGAYLLILLIGGIGGLFICYYLTSAALKEPYPQITGIILGSFFGLIGIFSLFCIYYFDTILIYSDHVLIQSIFGNTKKVIFLKDIESWTEVEKENKHSKWKELVIYTKQTKYQLSSAIYANYPQLKSALVSGKPRDFQKQDRRSRKNNLYLAIALSIVGGFFLYSAFLIYSREDAEVKYSQLQTITDTITNTAEIKKGSKRNSRSIQIRLKSFPSFNFNIRGNAYYAMHANNYVANIKVGDIIRLSIMKDEYQMKLTKEKPLGFWDKTINYSSIYVYELLDRKNTYLSLQEYNQESKNDFTLRFLFVFIFGLPGLGMLVVAFYLFIRHQQTRHNAS
jgi:hypothetical protein